MSVVESGRGRARECIRIQDRQESVDDAVTPPRPTAQIYCVADSSIGRRTNRPGLSAITTNVLRNANPIRSAVASPGRSGSRWWPAVAFPRFEFIGGDAERLGQVDQERLIEGLRAAPGIRRLPVINQAGLPVVDHGDGARSPLDHMIIQLAGTMSTSTSQFPPTVKSPTSRRPSTPSGYRLVRGWYLGRYSRVVVSCSRRPTTAALRATAGGAAASTDIAGACPLHDIATLVAVRRVPRLHA